MQVSRVITGGMRHIPDASVFEKMQWMQGNADDIRLMMRREPRGHPALWPVGGCMFEATHVGPRKAIVATLSGQDRIYGTSNWAPDPTGPFPRGCKVGDIWG